MTVQVVSRFNKNAPLIDSHAERQILTGMVISDRVCQALEPLWRDEALKHPYSKYVGKWCLEYFKKYGKSPGRQIEDIYRNNISSIPTADADGINEFLSSINDEFQRQQESFNADYIIDIADTHFRLGYADNLRERMGSAIATGKPEEVESLISNYVRPARPMSKGYNPITDLDQILKAFEAREENAILKYPGFIGNFVGPIYRGDLAAIVGPSGIGKTWWLLFNCFVACMKGLNTIFFSFEMPHEQITYRVQQMITGLTRQEDSGTILLPVWDCLANQYNTCRQSQRKNSIGLAYKSGKKWVVPKYNEAPQSYLPCDVCRYDKNLQRFWYPTSWFIAQERDGITKSSIISKHKALIKGAMNRMGDFHIVAVPSGEMSVGDVRSYIKNRAYYDNIISDVIVTDSADKMKADSKKGEHRHGIYDIWMGHKALAQEMHSAVFTASHSNTERTGKRIRQGDWAEDIRKLRESDVAFGLNKPFGDDEAGRYSVNILKLRDRKFNPNMSAMVLSSLTIGRPVLDSALEKNFKIPEI